MDEFRLTSPECPVNIPPKALEVIRQSLAETRATGTCGGVGFDILAGASDVMRRLEELAQEYGCLVDGPYDSDEEDGGGYFTFERRDAPNVVDGGWLTKPEPTGSDDLPSYRGMA